MKRHFILSNGKTATTDNDEGLNNLKLWARENEIGLSEIYHYRTPSGQDYTIPAWGKDEALKDKALAGAYNVEERKEQESLRNLSQNPAFKNAIRTVGGKINKKLSVGGGQVPTEKVQEGSTQLYTYGQQQERVREAQQAKQPTYREQSIAQAEGKLRDYMAEADEMTLHVPPESETKLYQNWSDRFEYVTDMAKFYANTILPTRSQYSSPWEREVSAEFRNLAKKNPLLAATLGSFISGTQQGVYGSVDVLSFTIGGQGTGMGDTISGISRGLATGITERNKAWGDVGSAFSSFGMTFPMTVGLIMAATASGGAAIPAYMSAWANLLRSSGTIMMGSSIAADKMREYYQSDGYLSSMEKLSAFTTATIQSLTENIGTGFQTGILTKAFRVGGTTALRQAVSDMVTKAVLPTAKQRLGAAGLEIATEIIQENLQEGEDIATEYVLLGKPIPSKEELWERCKRNTIGALYGSILQGGLITGVTIQQSRVSKTQLASLSETYKSAQEAQMALNFAEAQNFKDAGLWADKAAATADKEGHHNTIDKAIANVRDAVNLYNAQTALSAKIQTDQLSKDIELLQKEEQVLDGKTTPEAQQRSVEVADEIATKQGEIAKILQDEQFTNEAKEILQILMDTENVEQAHGKFIETRVNGGMTQQQAEAEWQKIEARQRDIAAQERPAQPTQPQQPITAENPQYQVVKGKTVAVQPKVGSKTYITTQEAASDQENKQGLPSEEQAGQEPVQTQPIQTPSSQAAKASGVVQTPQQAAGYHVAVRGHDKFGETVTNKKVEDAAPVLQKEHPELDLFIHRETYTNGNKGNWIISTNLTGRRLSTGVTRIEAIENAKKRIAQLIDKYGSIDNVIAEINKSAESDNAEREVRRADAKAKAKVTYIYNDNIWHNGISDTDYRGNLEKAIGDLKQAKENGFKYTKLPQYDNIIDIDTDIGLLEDKLYSLNEPDTFKRNVHSWKKYNDLARLKEQLTFYETQLDKPNDIYKLESPKEIAETIREVKEAIRQVEQESAAPKEAQTKTPKHKKAPEPVKPAMKAEKSMGDFAKEKEKNDAALALWTPEMVIENTINIPDSVAEEALLKLFKNQVEGVSHEGRTMRVKFKDGRELELNRRTGIIEVWQGGKLVQRGIGETRAERVKGSIRVIVDLVDGYNGGNKTLFHEAFHVAWKLFLTNDQIDFITRMYGKKLGTGDIVAIEEAAANAAEQWLWKRSTATTEGKIWQRFWDRVRNALIALKLAPKGAKLQDIFYQLEQGKLTGKGTQGLGSRAKVADLTVPEHTDKWTFVGGDIVSGDVIRYTEKVFDYGMKKSIYLGERTNTVEILKDSYGADRMQHTFTVRVVDSEGYQALDRGTITRRKGRNLYRSEKLYRLEWKDESARQSARDEKHARGNAARTKKAQLIESGEWYRSRYKVLGTTAALALDKANGGTYLMDQRAQAIWMSQQKSGRKPKYTALEIKLATGWEMGTDNLWRYEAPDANVDWDKAIGSGKREFRLDEILPDEQLFTAYPDLRETKVRLVDTVEYKSAGYNEAGNYIEIGTDTAADSSQTIDLLRTMKSMGDTQRNEVYDTLSGIVVHEVQHAIQASEGFARGGNLGWGDQGKYNDYFRLAGETESRNVTRRRNMTEAERRATLLETTEDVKRKKQVVSGVKEQTEAARYKILPTTAETAEAERQYKEVEAKYKGVDPVKAFKKDILNPLKREALKYDNFEDFSRAYSIYVQHGLYYHITDNPNFKYDPNAESLDYIGGNSKKGALMVSGELLNWDATFNPEDHPHTRNYVAVYDLGDAKYDLWHGRGFGGENYLTPEEAAKAVQLDFLTMEEAKKLYNKYNKAIPQSKEELHKLWTDAQANKPLTGQWLKAPNGKPSNLNERQWVQVRTPAFKAWFGDWENDPANASKVIDENGEPRVWWHASLREFNEFKQKGYRKYAFFAESSDKAMEASGINNYYRKHPHMIEETFPNVLPVFINAKLIAGNPKTGVNWYALDSEPRYDPYILGKRGFDAVWVDDEGGVSLAVPLDNRARPVGMPIMGETYESIANKPFVGEQTAAQLGVQWTGRLTGGLPGAGKSFGLKYAGISTEHYVGIDSDENKRYIVGTAGEAHDTSSRIAEVQLKRAIGDGYNFTYDSLLSNLEKADWIIQSLVEKGGKAEIFFTHADIFTSRVRTTARYESFESNREIPNEPIIKGANRSLPTLIKLWEKYQNNDNVDFYFMDNNDLGGHTRPVFTKINGELKVFDKTGFALLDSPVKLLEGGKYATHRSRTYSESDLQSRTGEIAQAVGLQIARIQARTNTRHLGIRSELQRQTEGTGSDRQGQGQQGLIPSWDYGQETTQIKSATGNVGTFSAENPDIRYKPAPMTPEELNKWQREQLRYMEAIWEKFYPGTKLPGGLRPTAMLCRPSGAFYYYYLGVRHTGGSRPTAMVCRPSGAGWENSSFLRGGSRPAAMVCRPSGACWENLSSLRGAHAPPL